MLPSLITLSLLLCMFLWALLIDFLIHLQKRNSGDHQLSRAERRKSRLASSFSEPVSVHSRLSEDTSLRKG